MPAELLLSPPQLTALAALLAGLAVATVALLVLGAVGAPVSDVGQSTFEIERRKHMRAGSGSYRSLEALVHALARWNRQRGGSGLSNLERDLRISPDALPWLPEEYLAVRQIESLFAGLFGYAFGVILFEDWFAAVVPAGMAAWGYQQLILAQVVSRARKQRQRFKLRLPYAVDLMALMMEAGAGFMDAMETMVAETRTEPLGQAFGEVLREIRLGRTRRDALLALQDRYSDADLTELLFAIVKGEELGTPLSQVLRSQADQMRLKRSQWAEKAASEAQAAIVFPGMVVMIGCLMIVAAPFLLEFLFDLF